MKKLKILTLVLAIAMIVTGVSYAAWSESLVNNTTVNTGEVDWCFTGLGTSWDMGLDYNCDYGEFAEGYWRQVDKDTGKTNFVFQDTDGDGDRDKLIVTVSKAYPGYYNSILFYVKNNGTVPVTIQQPVVDNPAAIQLQWLDNIGNTVSPGVIKPLSFHFRVTESAEESETYTFSINASAVQWNKY